ncbi:TIM barrel protein [Polaribacter sp. MSW13]|uniref:TIM barrel protein n=1 Tax=Polaribacter marinus TaxID=2916838 RepID=A0A9X1VPB0_9FLAO|nr:TIM barrel protein [Polaribacter marinus]MCI2229851.1 TIM barrel protein [Polaribacter marinus]
MQIDKKQIATFNKNLLVEHKENLTSLSKKHKNIEQVIDTISNYNIAIPSWALGAGGTRFGKFGFGGEPSNLEQKLEDIGVINTLTKSANAVSLHIPWDIPKDAEAIKAKAKSLGIQFDAMNSNTFQDQEGQEHSYKFGSLCHTDKKVRDQAVAHNKQVIDYGVALGSKSLTIWLADGSNFPGQLNFRRAFENTLSSLKEIYAHLPSDWKLFIEYKPYEPNFYSMVIQDWGTSHMLAKDLGEQAYTLVDLGHHLPNTNIEHIVATLMTRGMLGGFHFNDSKYGDDDLSVGVIKPYQLFLIFNELVFGMENNSSNNPIPAWMIDASHNLKDPLEDLIQSIEAIETAYAKALLIDQEALESAQLNNDVVEAQRILQDAFNTDVKTILAEARLRNDGAIDPILAFRNLEVRNELIKERGLKSTATGL